MNVLSTTQSQYADDAIWAGLKRAIASSSGFQGWQSEQIKQKTDVKDLPLEQQVSRYLRQTLETLAY